jgi:hypothetical protein
LNFFFIHDRYSLAKLYRSIGHFRSMLIIMTNNVLSKKFMYQN